MEAAIGVTSSPAPGTAPRAPQSPRTPRTPGQRDGLPLDHAVRYAERYAEERRWDVFPGTWLEAVGGVPRCSCGDLACATPGAHPANARWADDATGSVPAVRRLWSAEPRASVLLPTGRTFDAIDVPETAGCLAMARLERLTTPLGPVLSAPDGRMLFFVLPGAGARVPQLVRRLGWPLGALDLTVRGEGAWVAAPPTRLGARGPVQWVSHPSAANRWLPDAEAVLPSLTYACGRGATRPGPSGV